MENNTAKRYSGSTDIQQSKVVQMITRRTFIAATLAAPAVPLGSVLAQAVKEPPKQADFLFVQTAKRMTFDKSTNKLNLDGISSTTLFFSDRPERIAGAKGAPHTTIEGGGHFLQEDRGPQLAQVVIDLIRG